MKWLIMKLIMILCIGFGILNYSVYLTTGKSPLSNISFTLPSMPSFSNFKMPELNVPSIGDVTGESATPVKVYKWVDNNGVINYSQEKPDEMIAKAANVKELMVDPNTNVVQADKLPEPEPAPEPEKPKAAPATQVSLLPSPQNVKKLIEDAKGVQGLMDARTEALNKAVD